MTDDTSRPAGPPDEAAAAAAPPPEPTPRDDADVQLLGLIDRLADLLDRSDLAELEVEAGGTGLVLRKPSAVQAAPGAGAAGRQQPRPPQPAPPASRRPRVATRPLWRARRSRPR